jgi:hypothetical protein
VLDGLGFGDVKDAEKIRMNRCLPATDLHYIRLALTLHYGIQHGFNLLQCPVTAMGRRR